MVSFNLTIVLFGAKTGAKYRDVAPLSGTSKFSGARKVVGKTGKEVLLRRTLACGSRNGIGYVFCLTEAGEQQIGWVPEKDQPIMMLLERRAICQTSMPKSTVQVPKIWETSLPR